MCEKNFVLKKVCGFEHHRGPLPRAVLVARGADSTLNVTSDDLGPDSETVKAVGPEADSPGPLQTCRRATAEGCCPFVFLSLHKTSWFQLEETGPAVCNHPAPLGWFKCCLTL